MLLRNDPRTTVRTARIRRCLALWCAAALALFLVPASASGAGSTAGPAPAGRSGSTTAAPDQFTPLVATVLAEPHPVAAADGNVHLAYELLMLNPTSATVTVERVQALDARNPGRVLADLTGTSLDTVMTAVSGAPGRSIGAAQTFRALLDVQLGRGASVPRALVHRFTVTIAPPTDVLPSSFLAAATSVPAERTPVLGPPLQGPRWIQSAGCCAPGGHRIAIMPVNGGLFAAQRFAVDIAQLRADGRLFDGPIDQVTSYPSYGKPVLAAAAGVVVATRNDLPNQIPFAVDPVESFTAVTIFGNNVVVDIGNGRYTTYAHLKPGSVAVRVGDRVRQGQRLALLGNSGNTDLPHLHFQVTDGASRAGSQGLPYVLSSFDSPGSIPSWDQIDPSRPIPVDSGLRGHYERVIPMDMQLVDYPPA